MFVSLNLNKRPMRKKKVAPKAKIISLKDKKNATRSRIPPKRCSMVSIWGTNTTLKSQRHRRK
jgi:hypothetical protein